jgi:hypothetical protein
MSDGVQRAKSTVSRSVRDCLPICLPSTTRHSTFQRTPADDEPAYLAPRPPGGRRWHGRGQGFESPKLHDKVLVKAHLILKGAWLCYAQGASGVNGRRLAAISRALVIICWPSQILQAVPVPPALNACVTGAGSRQSKDLRGKRRIRDSGPTCRASRPCRSAQSTT